MVRPALAPVPTKLLARPALVLVTGSATGLGGTTLAMVLSTLAFAVTAPGWLAVRSLLDRIGPG